MTSALKTVWSRRRISLMCSPARERLMATLQGWSDPMHENRISQRYLAPALGDATILPFAIYSLHALGRGGAAHRRPVGGRRPWETSAVGEGAPGGPEGAERTPTAAGPAAGLRAATPPPGQHVPRRFAAARRGDFAGALAREGTVPPLRRPGPPRDGGAQKRGPCTRARPSRRR